MNPYSSNPFGSSSPYGSPSAPIPSGEEKNWAVGAHLSAFAHYIAPIFAFVIPLGIWIFKRNESVYVANQAKESLNFQISLWLWAMLGFLCFLSVVGILVAFAIWLMVGLAGILFPILGAVAVSDGRPYRYPLTIRLIS